ncbi:CRP/FNR family transcriptional regulator [Thiogranum longum]|uniref:CRP/FNR family transcriptional regulator n=1 Tax=Thiogranum longum TaxID=1537524 RepID=A0A4R1HDI5_9GAMM|nr:Crp/Fnr family transcriptional regulator [Thiogranum longum]TCK18210.1 CRP/FNR family transcriptional regulator [Thiogranum longum]
MAPPADNRQLLSLPPVVKLIENTPVSGYDTGDMLFNSGEPCAGLPVIISGNARIYASSEAGRQVTLYRLKAGEMCPISLSAVLKNSVYPATAIAESPMEVHFVSGDALKTTLIETPEIFGAFLHTFADCLYESVCTANKLMFEPLDVRLAGLLHEKLADNPEQSINFTHEDIAKELGTTRVVVSRLLKKLEHADCIRMQRRKITLQDANSLRKLAKNMTQGNAA